MNSQAVPRDPILVHFAQLLNHLLHFLLSFTGEAYIAGWLGVCVVVSRVVKLFSKC